MNQIDTRKYGDYTITDIFSKYIPIKRECDMKLILDHGFKRQHK